jgi:CRISPR-associated exonuclease Cas4
MVVAVGWLFLGVAALTGLVIVSVYFLSRRSAEAKHGRLVTVDVGGHRDPPLISHRLGLIGRPDELRRTPDGRPVPVEWKRRAAPSTGPMYSHRIQVAAYCLLLEEVEGVAPPYGVVRYGDHREFRLPWDAAARREVETLLEEMRRPYDGRATPSPGKCGRCPWRSGCDARAS